MPRASSKLSFGRSLCLIAASLLAGRAAAGAYDPVYDAAYDGEAADATPMELLVDGGTAIPPSWATPGRSGTTTDQGDILGQGTVRRTARRPARPWYMPRAALGMGVNFPELLPIEGYLFFGRYFALRAFYSPPVPITIRVDMPDDVIATKQGLAVANPAFTIHGKATFGESYGLEALVFPFGGSFFLSGGASHRHMRVVADAASPVLVCSVIEAAKEPPCGDPNASIETRTELTVHADAETDAVLLRYSLGWVWHIGSFGYFMLDAGATKPTHVTQSVEVDAGLVQPGGQDPDITGALAQVRDEQQQKLQGQALQAMQPVDDKVLPLLGIGAGVRF